MRVLCSLFIAAAVLGAAAWSSAQAKRTDATTLPPTFTDAALGMEFVLVKGGCFEMGDTAGDGDNDERPLHEVCVNDFYLGRYEVTNEQFKRFVEATGHRTTAEVKGSGWGFDREGSGDAKERSGLSWRHPLWPEDSIDKKMNHPVVQATWYDARELAAWLSRKNNRTVRLPYEAEWEYAARSGGKDYRYSWGAGPPAGNVADLQLKMIMPKIETFPGHDDGYRYTAPVGSYARNDLGLFDMTGNVWEWCMDWYDADYYNDSPKNNPTGPYEGQKKVMRGGSWNNVPRILRTTNRDDTELGQRFFNAGFRLAIPVR
jgi:formylglycine-generating enzyme required for sulfatase activity